jgi:hypothetical protein
MKKLYVCKNDKGKYGNGYGGWTKDINKAEIYFFKSEAKIDGTPVLVNIVEAE